MAYKSDKIFDAESIRDTNVHTGLAVSAEGFSKKTLVIENELNQAVTFTCEGSSREDFSKYFVIASFPWTANTIDYATCDSYIPFWRLKVQADTAPTSGTLTVFLERTS